MKTLPTLTSSPRRSTSIFLQSLLCCVFGLVAILHPASAQAQSGAVQPADRLVGDWWTEMDSLRDYLTSVLEPIRGTCESVEGPVRYNFAPGRPGTLTISIEKMTVRVKRLRRAGGPSDEMVLVYRGACQAPFSVSASELMLDVVTRTDFNRITIEHVSVNGIELPIGDVDLGGVSQPFGVASSKFEFVGDKLKLTPVFPPAPDGVRITARPIILRRGSGGQPPR